MVPIRLHVDFEACDPEALLEAIRTFAEDVCDRGTTLPAQATSTNGWSYTSTIDGVGSSGKKSGKESP